MVVCRESMVMLTVAFQGEPPCYYGASKHGGWRGDSLVDCLQPAGANERKRRESYVTSAGLPPIVMNCRSPEREDSDAC